MDDERQLLEAWRRGDQAAARLLFDRYFAALRRFFRGKVGEIGDDLAQTTLLRALEANSQIHSESSFRAYLFAIARNELYGHLRRAMTRRGEIDAEVTSIEDLMESPSHVLAARSERRQLLEALRRIPLDAQVLLELAYWEHFTSRELSAVLGVAPSSVRSRLGHARVLLATELRKLGRDERLETTSDDIEAWVRRIHRHAHGEE